MYLIDFNNQHRRWESNYLFSVDKETTFKISLTSSNKQSFAIPTTLIKPNKNIEHQITVPVHIDKDNKINVVGTKLLDTLELSILPASNDNNNKQLLFPSVLKYKNPIEIINYLEHLNTKSHSIYTFNLDIKTPDFKGNDISPRSSRTFCTINIISIVKIT